MISLDNVILVKTRKEFYDYLSNHYQEGKSFFVEVKKGNPNLIKEGLSYLDAVEVALCFGYIDSILKVSENKTYQRFSPRKSSSHFSELNKARCRRLIELGEMKEEIITLYPDFNKPYIAPKYLLNAIQKDEEAYEFFISTPILYQNIRLYNLDFTKKNNPKGYKSALHNFLKNCRQKKVFGQWDDYGRLKH